MLTITDLQNEQKLSSVAMSKIGGGMSCEAGMGVAQVYLITSVILGGLGDKAGQLAFVGKADGVLTGACT